MDIKTLPKKLVDLHPEWLRNKTDATSEKWGIQFYCPCGTPPRRDCTCADPECPTGPNSSSLVPGCDFAIVALMFDNPVSGPVSKWGREKWHRDGDTFETLTLSPSIHAVGHWHGWLRNGMLVSC